MLDQNYLDTAHLLRRAGFGASPDTIKAAAEAGLGPTTDALLHPENGPQDVDDSEMIYKLVDMIPERKNKQTPVQFVKVWWTHRMLTTQHPLVEKMVLFWHGHFTSKLGDGDAMLEQNQLFRQQALGNFRTLALAVSRDTAMLKYLNGNENFKAHANENYGRELMELFTCGIGNYTEDDVKAAARAFSGWNLRQGEFHFNPRQHDDSTKTFLGRTGNWNGDDIIDILVAHPSTARRLCTQLFEYFAYPDPEPAVLEALTTTYYASGYDIRAVVGQILKSNAFYSAKARNAIIKCPVQYVVGTIKMLGIEQGFDLDPAEIDAEATETTTDKLGKALNPLRGTKVGRLAGLTVAMRSMGQDILSPPSVKGWDGEEAWINSATLLNRINFANRIAQSRPLYRALRPQVMEWGINNNVPESTAWVDYLAYTLGPLQITSKTRDTLVAFAEGQGEFSGHDDQLAVHNEDPVVAYAVKQADADRPVDNAPRRQDPGRMLALLPLIMATPEYQVC